jgi:uncharacterized protein (DUF1778 family)
MATKRRKAKAERKEESIRLRLTTEEKTAFNEAAAREGRDLSNWLRWVARREAKMIDV